MSKKSMLSNWYPASFEEDGTQCDSVEQHYMFKKCTYHGKKDLAMLVKKQ